MQLVLSDEEVAVLEWFLETGRARTEVEDKARSELMARLAELCPWKE